MHVLPHLHCAGDQIQVFLTCQVSLLSNKLHPHLLHLLNFNNPNPCAPSTLGYCCSLHKFPPVFQPPLPSQGFQMWLPIPYVNFFVMKSLGSWQIQEAEHRELINSDSQPSRSKMLTQLVSIKGRKLEMSQERSKQKRAIWQHLSRPIAAAPQRTGARCMLLAAFAWSWIGTILRKGILGRQANKCPCHHSLRPTQYGFFHIYCQSSLLPATVPWLSVEGGSKITLYSHCPEMRNWGKGVEFINFS